VYLLDTTLTLPHVDFVIDLDRLSTQQDYRRETTLAVRGLTGLPDLTFDDCRLPRHAVNPAPPYRAILQEAVEFLDRQPIMRSEARLSIRAKLEESLARFV
jgi:hypothetical protein